MSAPSATTTGSATGAKTAERATSASGAPASRSRRRRSTSPRDTITNPIGRIVVIVILVLSAVYFLLPVWWLLVSATKPFGYQFNGSGLWFQGFGLWGNIQRLLNQENGIFFRWMLNSILYSGCAAFFGTLFSAMAGYALAKYAFPGRGAVFGTILAAVLIPQILFTLPLFLMFSGVGLINNPLAVILPSVVSPFGVYLARVFAAQSVPDELVEAGRLDGAGEWRIFSRIAVRIMMPALVTIFLFQFVNVWNNYLLPAMVLNDSRLQTVAVGLVAWNGSNGKVPEPLVVIAAFLSIIPLVIAFLCLQRFWRAGLTAGAVK